MQISFGQAFRALRQQKGTSQRELARRSGVAVRTIVYWEAGERLPRIPELQIVLGVLRATPQETAQLANLLTTPRGLRMIKAECTSGEPPPGMGDLLRAMRLRSGLTQEKLAEKLQVTRHSVLRWESMQNLINDENLVRLCELLHAAPEEHAALKTRRLPLPHWELLDNQNVENLTRFWHEIHVSDSPLRDLYAMALKRHLYVLTETNMGAARLLGLIEGQHGVWLDLQERTQEARGCIERALQWMQKDSVPQSYWAEALNLATHHRYKNSSVARSSINLLEEWLPRLPNGSTLTLQLCDMAIYSAFAGASETAAQTWLAQAERSLDRGSERTSSDVCYWQISSARIALMFGHYTEAFAGFLPHDLGDAQRLQRLLIFTQTLLSSGQVKQATSYLSQAQQFVKTETPPKLRRLFAQLSYRL